MSCNIDTLLSQAAANGFFSLQDRELRIAILQLLCDSSPATVPPLKYVAILNQIGSNNPIATVFENTLGNIVWTRQDVGVYNGALANAFTDGNTFVMINQTSFSRTTGFPEDNSNIRVETFSSAGPEADGILVQTAIEIRVYP